MTLTRETFVKELVLHLIDTMCEEAHGGMWGYRDCDRYCDTDTRGTTAHAPTWIFPCQGEYHCPYLNHYAEAQRAFIIDEDTGEVDEDFDDVCCRFEAEAYTIEDTCIITFGIDNQADENRCIYRRDIDLTKVRLTKTLIKTICEEVDNAVTNYTNYTN